jgi:hypothetical protein
MQQVFQKYCLRIKSMLGVAKVLPKKVMCGRLWYPSKGAWR